MTSPSHTSSDLQDPGPASTGEAQPGAPVLRRLLLAKALRSFGDGYMSLLLPLHLLRQGMSAAEVGLLATATLVGSGLLTMLVGAHAARWPTRRWLIGACVLMAATGLALTGASGFWPMLIVALVGTLSPTGGDVSVFLPLEHSMLSRSVDDRHRTDAFARYSLAGTLAAAAGALAAGLPTLLPARTGFTEGEVIQAMFLGYAGLAGLSALVYRGLPREPASRQGPETTSALGPSRRRVLVLAALFSLDAFGGGFVVQSLVALWLYQRFNLPVSTAGSIFFVTGVLTAFSYLVASRLANRFGLLRTMVFTHLPSSLCLLALPFCATLGAAVALLLVRAALSQMDVPTRSSYVMAVVTPPERAAAASATSVPRSLAAAISPAIAGYLLSASPFGWPFILAGALKISYDLLLLAMFHRVRPPEEVGRRAQ